ncbi:hypothetical protein HPB48_015939 [Haemaphysalis longicornis]|uniref:Fibronectin type-III domain-containing protein n=1 Tax=Haemaphysalis longicornis TaxID=44386 RepID=A0A9J6FR75_HAELO|nr:hypothetical protein HPB48_015939 [Haemaphysalis longicornis]
MPASGGGRGRGPGVAQPVAPSQPLVAGSGASQGSSRGDGTSAKKQDAGGGVGGGLAKLARLLMQKEKVPGERSPSASSTLLSPPGPASSTSSVFDPVTGFPGVASTPLRRSASIDSLLDATAAAVAAASHQQGSCGGLLGTTDGADETPFQTTPTSGHSPRPGALPNSPSVPSRLAKGVPALFAAVEHHHIERARSILESSDVDVNSPLALYETVALFCLAFREKEIRCKKREGGGEQKAKQRIFWPAASTRGAALPTSEVRERTAVTPPPTPVPGPGRRAKEQTRSNGFPGSQPPPLFSCPVAFVRRERRLSNAGLGRWPPLLPAREPERLHVRADDRPRSSKIVCYESARSFEAPASRRSLAHRLIRRLLCTSAKLSSALRQSSSCNVFCTVNTDGFTALDVAVLTGESSLARLLQSRGASESPRFPTPEARASQLAALLREAHRCVDDLTGCVASASANQGSLSNALLKEKERQLSLWKRRLELISEMKAGFDELRPPDPPSQVTLDVVGTRSLRVRFSEPLSALQARIFVTKYRVEWCDREDFALGVGSRELSDVQCLEFVIRDLEKGRPYFVRVAAGNAKGFSDYQTSWPPSARPSSWRDVEDCSPRWTGRIDRLDSLFLQVMESRPLHGCTELQRSNTGSGVGPATALGGSGELCEVTPMQQRRQMRKSIRQLFAAAPKFQRTLKRGVYLACLFYNEDRILVTTEETLPILEVDDSYPASFHTDFHWLMKARRCPPLPRHFHDPLL